MAYSTVPTVATGDSWSASQHNTYIRDNFTTLWPYTAIGDIAYASSASALTVLPIGTNGDILQTSSSLPDWGAIPAFRTCYIKRVANQSIPTGGTGTPISFDTEVINNFGMWSSGDPTKLTLPIEALYRFTVRVSFATNSTGRRAIYFYYGYNQSKPAIAGYPTVISYSGVEKIAPDPDITVNVYQNSGGALNVTASLLLELIG